MGLSAAVGGGFDDGVDCGIGGVVMHKPLDEFDELG